MKKYLKEMKCSKCGGNLIFDPATQMNTCQSCGNSFLISDGTEIGGEQQAIICPNCGGSLDFDPTSQILQCKWCNSEFEIEMVNEEIPQDADSIMPFSISEKEAKISIINWLATGDFCPNDIYEKVHSFHLQGVYVPFHEFGVKYTATYTASLGYDKEERYTEFVNDEPRTKTKTVTEWQPHTGVISDSIHIKTVASTYIEQLGLKDVLSSCEGMREMDKRECDKRYFAGFRKAPVEISAAESYGIRGKSKLVGHIEQIALLECMQMTPHVKGLNVHVQDELISYELGYRPLWISPYQYYEDSYACVVNGCDSQEVYGTKPCDDGKKNKTAGLKSARNFSWSLTAIIFLISILIAQPVAWIIGVIFLIISITCTVQYGRHTLDIKESLRQREEIRDKILQTPDDFFAKKEPAHKKEFADQQSEMQQATEARNKNAVKKHDKNSALQILAKRKKFFIVLISIVVGALIVAMIILFTATSDTYHSNPAPVPTVNVIEESQAPSIATPTSASEPTATLKPTATPSLTARAPQIDLDGVWTNRQNIQLAEPGYSVLYEDAVCIISGDSVIIFDIVDRGGVLNVDGSLGPFPATKSKDGNKR